MSEIDGLGGAAGSDYAMDAGVDSAGAAGAAAGAAEAGAVQSEVEPGGFGSTADGTDAGTAAGPPESGASAAARGDYNLTGSIRRSLLENSRMDVGGADAGVEDTEPSDGGVIAGAPGGSAAAAAAGEAAVDAAPPGTVRDVPPAGWNEPVDLNSPEGRERLVAGAGQLNPVSDQAGNGNDICGPASTVDALILTDQGGNNARALESTLRERNVPVSEREQAALDNFKSGKMTPEDVAHLQQATNRLGHEMQGDSQQLNPPTMAALNGALKSKGAYEGADVTFHMNRNDTGVGGASGNHWTATVNGTHVDTGFRDKAQIANGTPADVPTHPSDPKMRGEVALTSKPPHLSVDWKDKDTGDAAYRHAEINPDPRTGWGGAEDRIADGVKKNQSKLVPASDAEAAARRHLEEARNKGTGILATGDDDWIRDNIKESDLRYASADDKLRMIEVLKSGVYSADDKAMVNRIVASAASEEERRKLAAAAK